MYILCYPNSIPILPTPSHIWSVHPFVTPYPLLHDPPPPPAKGHRARAQGCEGAAAGHCHNPYHLGIIFKPSLYCDIGPIGDALWLGLPHHSIYLFLLLSEISGWSMNLPCVAHRLCGRGTVGLPHRAWRAATCQLWPSGGGAMFDNGGCCKTRVGRWLIIGDYTTQYIGDYSDPLGESLLTNQCDG